MLIKLNILIWIVKSLLLGFLIILNVMYKDTIPLTIMLAVLYIFYLETKIIKFNFAVKDTVKKIDSDISKLYDNQKSIMTLFNSFKQIIKKFESKKSV
jgi:hypothetical protein